MNAGKTEQKTAVFTPVSDAEDKTRAFPVLDEDTRELPLIADRFAGRYWDGREAEQPPKKKPARRKAYRTAFAFGFGTLAAVLLLVASLMGQAKLTAMNDELVTVSGRIAELQTEQRALCVQTEAAESLSAIEGYAVETLGMHFPRLDQQNAGTAETPDRATVLHVRRGQGFAHAWEKFIDTLVACF